MSKTSDDMRKTVGEIDRARDAGLVTPDDVLRYDDIVYGDDCEWQIMDVYRPKASEGKILPVIVSVHGGGWVYGTKEAYQFYCMSLAQRGFAVVNFTYRLAPEYQYPAAIEDINTVFTWITNHAAEYGMDRKHLFAVGDSAGAHQLSLYTAILTNEEYSRQYPFTIPDGLELSALALNCGVYHFDKTKCDEHTILLMEDYLPCKGSKEELDEIDIPSHITPDFPPVFVMTAVEDTQKMQAPYLVKALTENKIPFVYRMYGDAEHPLGHVFHCDIKTDDAGLCNDEECRFFLQIGYHSRPNVREW